MWIADILAVCREKANGRAMGLAGLEGPSTTPDATTAAQDAS